MFACIRPCVRKSASTESMNAFRFMKKPCIIGFFALFSTINSATRFDHFSSPYSKKILESFSSMGMAIGSGNVVFPKGRACEYFSEYFLDHAPDDPYEEDPYDVRCISFDPNGDVLQGNVYACDIMKIIADYAPV